MSAALARSIQELLDADHARQRAAIAELVSEAVPPAPAEVAPHDRTINQVFIHCSATPEGRDVSVETIRKWHTDPEPEGRGWNDVGYHWIVGLDGTASPGRPEAIAGAHAVGHNAHSIGICYVGGTDLNGKPKDTRTFAQMATLDRLVDEIRARYGQHVEVWGHNEVTNAKACPSFDVQADRRARRR